eukprot:5269079-Prymnesium_polylepis.1
MLAPKSVAVVTHGCQGEGACLAVGEGRDEAWGERSRRTVSPSSRSRSQQTAGGGSRSVAAVF